MFLMYPFITGKSADNKATNLEYLAAAHFLGVHSGNEEMLAALSEEQLSTVNKMFNHPPAPQEEMLNRVKVFVAGLASDNDPDEPSVDSSGTDQPHRPHANRSGDTSLDDHTQNRRKSTKQSKQASDAHDEDDEEESFSDDSADEEGLFGNERQRRCSPRRGSRRENRPSSSYSNGMDGSGHLSSSVQGSSGEGKGRHKPRRAEKSRRQSNDNNSTPEDSALEGRARRSETRKRRTSKTFSRPPATSSSNSSASEDSEADASRGGPISRSRPAARRRARIMYSSSKSTELRDRPRITAGNGESSTTTSDDDFDNARPRRRSSRGERQADHRRGRAASGSKEHLRRRKSDARSLSSRRRDRRRDSSSDSEDSDILSDGGRATTMQENTRFAKRNRIYVAAASAACGCSLCREYKHLKKLNAGQLVRAAKRYIGTFSKSAGMGRHGVLVQPPTGGGPLGTLVQNGARIHHLVSYHANDVVSGSTLWCCKEHHLISSTRLRPGGAEAVVDQLDALPTGDFVVANRTHLADAFCSKQSNFIRQAQHPSLQPGGVVDKL